MNGAWNCFTEYGHRWLDLIRTQQVARRDVPGYTRGRVVYGRLRTPFIPSLTDIKADLNIRREPGHTIYFLKDIKSCTKSMICLIAPV